MQDIDFKTFRPKVAFLFPGQGAQKLGMCQEVTETVPAARDLFEKASGILGYDLLRLCVEGPEAQLNSTVYSQPALYVASMAAIEKLKTTQGPDAVKMCDVTCGLSLGEYAALTFAGVMTFEDGVKLVQLRGEAMQAAADASESAMVSVIGLSNEQVEALCAEASKRAGEGEWVKIANFLCPGNITVAGSKAACEKLAEIAKPDFKARLAKKLAVSGAFHTETMNPAVQLLKKALETTTFQSPSIPVISNVTAEPHSSNPDTIKEMLCAQMTSPVQWEQTMTALLGKGLERSFELGTGTVLSGILKRIDKEHPVENIEP